MNEHSPNDNPEQITAEIADLVARFFALYQRINNPPHLAHGVALEDYEPPPRAVLERYQWRSLFEDFVGGGVDPHVAAERADTCLAILRERDPDGLTDMGPRRRRRVAL